MEQQTVILYRPSALGDVAMTIPAAYTLALTNHRLKVVMVTNAKFASLFINPPANLSVVGIEKQDFSNLRSVVALANRLAAMKPAAFIDMHNTLRSMIIDTVMLMHGCRVRMLDKRRLDRLAIIHLKRATKRNFTLRYFDVIRRAGFALDDSLFTGLKTDAPTASPCRRRRIGIAPFARYATKAYPVDMMEHVVARLSSLHDYEILLFGGGKAELDILDSWRRRYDAVTYVSGALTLDQEVGLMASLDVMVTMDSANMHLASLTATRVISIWGGTTPACGFLGWNQRRSDAIVAGLKCQPCSTAGTPTCPRASLECMTAIEPEAIVARIVEACADRQ